MSKPLAPCTVFYLQLDICGALYCDSGALYCILTENAEGAKIILNVDENVTKIRNVKLDQRHDGCGDSRERLMEFGFDYCYWSVDADDPKYASQEVVFQDLGTSVLSEAIKGYNVCLFAYGQTGSGKTYTMMGTPTSVGLTPRICEGLFSCADGTPGSPTSCRIEVSFLEIYNERVRDLLNQSVQKKPYTLRVREHPEKGPYVQGLSQHVVTDYEQVVSLLEGGMENRITAATHVHDASSRSHAIFTIQYTQAMLEDNLPSEIASKINLVDLAGSERASPNYCKDRLTEGSNINRSLVTLSIVISALAQNSQKTSSSQSINNVAIDWDSGSPASPNGSSLNYSKRQPYVPYRDSILTWLLKDSLGGNSKTVMIATVSPASTSYNETLSTLRYAASAKNIINKPRVNEDANVKLIRDLREEINRLKLMLRSFETRTSSPFFSEEREGNLTELVLENELKIEQLTKDWTDKWMDKADIMDQYKVDISKGKAGVTIDPNLPHLIAMDDDILSTGVVIYHLREGTTNIGRSDSDQDHDIVLNGEWMAKEHCVIDNNSGVVELRSLPGALCTVNGKEVTDVCRLSQGAAVVLGRIHRFRFNHPAEAAILRQQRSDSQASFISSDSLDWLDLSENFLSNGPSITLNARNTDPLNPEHQQKLRDLEAFYQQQVEEQQRYVQDLKTQIAAAQIKGEKELEQEQSLINKLINENQQWVLKEEQHWTTVHQQRQESASQTDPRIYSEADVQNCVQTEDIQPSPAEQDRKRLVQSELLRKYSLRRAERNIKRKRVKFQLEWISKKQKLLEAKKNLQQLQAACWVNEDTVKQTFPHIPSAQGSTGSCTLPRSRSSPAGFTYHRRGSLPWSSSPLPSYSTFIKRKVKSDLIVPRNSRRTYEGSRPRRSVSADCLPKTACNCKSVISTNGVQTAARFADKRTFGSVGNLNRTVSPCYCTTLLESNPQMSKKHPNMDKAGNSSKKFPNSRLTDPKKKRNARVPANQESRETKPKSFKTPSQPAAGTLRTNSTQEKCKIVQKNEGTKCRLEKSIKNTKQTSVQPRHPVRPSTSTNKAVKHLAKTTLPYNQKLSTNGATKISSSVGNLHKLVPRGTIDTKWKSVEMLDSGLLKPTPDLLEHWEEGDESGSSDSESFYSMDSLSSAYASVLNEQLKLEEAKSVANQKNSDSEDSQMSQDSLAEREKQKEKPNKRRFRKYKAIITSSEASTSGQNSAPVVLAGSIASGVSKSFSLDSLADADEVSEADSTEELPAEIYWKLQSPRFSMLHAQDQSEVDATEESNNSTMELNSSFFLNVNQGSSLDYSDSSLIGHMDTCLKLPMKICDEEDGSLEGTNHITPPHSSLGSGNKDCRRETAKQIEEDKPVMPSLFCVPKNTLLFTDEDVKPSSPKDTFMECDLQHSRPHSPMTQNVQTLQIENDQGHAGTLEKLKMNLKCQKGNLESKITEISASEKLVNFSDISSISSDCDVNDVQNQNDLDEKFICAEEETCELLNKHSKSNQEEYKSSSKKSEVKDFGQQPFKKRKGKCTASKDASNKIEKMYPELQPVSVGDIDSCNEMCDKKTGAEKLDPEVCEEPICRPLLVNTVNIAQSATTASLTTEKDRKRTACQVLVCNEMASDVTATDQEKCEIILTHENLNMCHCSSTSAESFDNNENVTKAKSACFCVESVSSSGESQQYSAVKSQTKSYQVIENLHDTVSQLQNETEIDGTNKDYHYAVPYDQENCILQSQPSMSSVMPGLKQHSNNEYDAKCKPGKEADSGTSGTFQDDDNKSKIQRQDLDEHSKIVTVSKSNHHLNSDSGVQMHNSQSSSVQDRTTLMLCESDSLDIEDNHLSEESDQGACSLNVGDRYSFSKCAPCESTVLVPEQSINVSEGDGTCEQHPTGQRQNHTEVQEETDEKTALLDTSNKCCDRVNLKTHEEVKHFMFSTGERKAMATLENATMSPENIRKIALLRINQQAVDNSVIKPCFEEFAREMETVLKSAEVKNLNAESDMLSPKCTYVPDKTSESFYNQNKNSHFELETGQSEILSLDLTKPLHSGIVMNSLECNTTDRNDIIDMSNTVLGNQDGISNLHHDITDIERAMRYQLETNESSAMDNYSTQSNESLYDHLEDFKNPKLVNSDIGQLPIHGDNYMLYEQTHNPRNNCKIENSGSNRGVPGATSEGRISRDSTLSRYKHIDNDGFSTRGRVGPSEHSENLYLGINFPSSSLQANNECADDQRLEYMSGASLVLPYYEAIMQHELSCESKNSKVKNIISGPDNKKSDISKIEGNNKEENKSNSETEMPLSSSQAYCTKDGCAGGNLTTHSIHEFLSKDTSLPLALSSIKYELIDTHAIKNSFSCEPEISDIMPENINLNPISLNQEKGFSTTKTSKMPQNVNIGSKRRYFRSKSEEMGVSLDTDYELGDRPGGLSQTEGRYNKHLGKICESLKVKESSNWRDNVFWEIPKSYLAEKEQNKVETIDYKQKSSCPVQGCESQYKPEIICSMPPLAVIDDNVPDIVIQLHQPLSEVNNVPECSCVDTCSSKPATIGNDNEIGSLSSICFPGQSQRLSQLVGCGDFEELNQQLSCSGNANLPMVLNTEEQKQDNHLSELQEKDTHLGIHLLDDSNIAHKHEVFSPQPIYLSSERTKQNDVAGDSAVMPNVSCGECCSDDSVVAIEPTKPSRCLISHNNVSLQDKSLKMGYVEDDVDIGMGVNNFDAGGLDVNMPTNQSGEVTRDQPAYLKVEGKITEEYTECSLSHTLMSPTNATNCETAHLPSFVSAKSIQTQINESLPDYSGSVFDTGTFSVENEGVYTESDNLSGHQIMSGVKTFSDPANKYTCERTNSCVGSMSNTTPEDISWDQEVDSKEYLSDTSKMISIGNDSIQTFPHQVETPESTSVDKKECLHFSSSDINPFVRTWHSEEDGKAGWKQYAFNSVSDVSCSKFPAKLVTDKIIRCSSADEGLNAHNSPFHSHLSSYANARLISSTLSSIEGQQEADHSADDSVHSLDGSQYYYPLPGDNTELSKNYVEPTIGSRCLLNPKLENESAQFDEIVFLYTSESETCNESDLRIGWEQGSQMKDRHRRLNRHQRSHTDVSHEKPSKIKTRHPRPASWSSVQDMSLHLSQLLHETTELLGTLSQHRTENFFNEPTRLQEAAARSCIKRDSSTQTTVDAAIQTELEAHIYTKDNISDNQGKVHNRLSSGPEINVIVKVIGTDSVNLTPGDSRLAIKPTSSGVPKTQSLPDLQDLPACGQSQRRLCHSAHGRASTPFLGELQEGISERSSQPFSRGSLALTVKDKATEHVSCSETSSSASSTKQKVSYHSGQKSNIKMSHQKMTSQANTIMVDRATSPILTVKASKKSLDKIIPVKDFTSQTIVKLLRHRRERNRGKHEPQVDTSSQTETDSECSSVQGTSRVLSKHECSMSLGGSTERRLSESKKLSPRCGSEDCITTGVQPLVFNRSRSISEVSGVGKLSNDIDSFPLRRRDKADGTSATALNSHLKSVPSWERPQSMENLSLMSHPVKIGTKEIVYTTPRKDHCNEETNLNNFAATSNNSFLRKNNYLFSEMSGFDLHLQDDGESVVESECDTDILLNPDSSTKASHKTPNYTLQDLPLHNKFSNWSGVQCSPARRGSLIRSSVDLSMRESPTKTEGSTACESRTKEIEQLQRERAEIMSGIHLDLNPQPLTVQLAEAKLNYGIGETDALLRVIQTGKMDSQNPVSIKKQLYDRHMKVIESLRKEREEKLLSYRRSRSLSPQKHLSASQGSLASLRESDLPSRRREYLQQLRKDVVDTTRIQQPKRIHKCPSEIEIMLKDYQKAREEAKTEIARARDKLRERAEQEKRRVHNSQPKDDMKLKTLTSTSTLFTNSSLSLSSGPTSGYNSSITATYGKSHNTQETKTSPKNMDLPSVSTRGRTAGRNSHLLLTFHKGSIPVTRITAKEGLTAESPLSADAGQLPSPLPPSSRVSYQEFSQLVQANAKAEVMASCDGNLKNLFLHHSESGWRYQCVERDVCIYYKAFPSSTKHGFLGAGVIKRPLHDVWCMVKDIGTRRLYDQTILTAHVHQRVSSGIQLLHVVSDVSLCYLKQRRDFCCISVESKQEEMYSLCFQSLYDETMPRPSKDTVRGEILPSAWILQADSINGETVTRVVYMVQVDLGAPTLPSRLLPVVSKRQPLVIASLAKFLS
ncbi:stAR-related lipid transfer 9 [Pelobates cultripes]|uniref:StAR-related lipid transfer 9 n=3 Tax=Pelobates cultripes TaxID=61616 RepID=A0AAD1WZ75_PELCU|nr:stAR-related lipid transfer 9 [Pelobates cultripes]